MPINLFLCSQEVALTNQRKLFTSSFLYKGPRGSGWKETVGSRGMAPGLPTLGAEGAATSLPSAPEGGSAVVH